MKEAILKGAAEGACILLVLGLFGFLSIGMAEFGKIHPYLTIGFYLMFIMAIPITFNVLSFKKEQKKEEKKEEMVA